MYEGPTEEFFKAQREKLAELLDQEPERISVTRRGSLVARYKDCDVRFTAFTIRSRDG